MKKQKDQWNESPSSRNKINKIKTEQDTEYTTEKIIIQNEMC